jgi:tryptophan synthase alpha chain
VTVDRIDRCFQRLQREGRTALVAYLTIGEPSVTESCRYALAAIEAGADILELGVPFSDPTADGPVIAAASYRAIKNGGSLKSALEVGRSIRSRSDAPLILFTYYNPIVAFGDRRVIQEASSAGIDGILIVDLPPEEGAELRAAASEAALAIIPLVAPTTSLAREPKVLKGARGFLYYVSLTGVTGAGAAPLDKAGREAAALGGRAGLPVVVGFGISSAEKARQAAASGAAGVAVGTAVVRATSEPDTPALREQAVRDLLSSIRRGLDAR